MEHTWGPKGFPYCYFGDPVYTIQLHGCFWVSKLCTTRSHVGNHDVDGAGGLDQKSFLTGYHVINVIPI